jgi:hypothetical protein
MAILDRIAQFAERMNHGDEICLSTRGSVENGTGLILGYGSTGFYLQDDRQRAELNTVDPAAAAAAAEEWAADTGAALIGQQSAVQAVQEVLDSTAIGNGLHRWGVTGGAIEVPTEELRPVLEEAYDPNMPGWTALITWDEEDGFFVP